MNNEMNFARQPEKDGMLREQAPTYAQIMPIMQKVAEGTAQLSNKFEVSSSEHARSLVALNELLKRTNDELTTLNASVRKINENVAFLRGFIGARGRGIGWPATWTLGGALIGLLIGRLIA